MAREKLSERLDALETRVAKGIQKVTDTVVMMIKGEVRELEGKLEHAQERAAIETFRAEKAEAKLAALCQALRDVETRGADVLDTAHEVAYEAGVRFVLEVLQAKTAPHRGGL